MNFDDSVEYDSAEIVSSDFWETYWEYFTDEEYEFSDYPICPNCSREIHADSDGGNGFCVDCAPNH